MFRYSLPSLFFSLSLGACASNDAADPWNAGDKADDIGSGGVVYATAMTVREMALVEEVDHRSQEELERTFSESMIPGGDEDVWTYLDTMRAMGYFGPIGPYGPLGVVGPIGTQPWNAELYRNGDIEWAEHTGTLLRDFDCNDDGKVSGPLSADGPLAACGPLAPGAHDSLEQAAGALGDFTTHLRPGGIFAVLGPIGVSGALGPLGPLGPLGAHDNVRDDATGEWIPADGDTCGQAPSGAEQPPCRSVDVEWATGETRTYDLVERYEEDHARNMTDNDTSFMVIGEMNSPSEDADTYAFTSDEDQWVTVMVVPSFAKYPFVQAMAILGQSALSGFEVPSFVTVPNIFSLIPIGHSYDHGATFDDFDLKVSVDTGSQTGSIVSDSGFVIDWVHLHVPAGTRLEAAVNLHRAWSVNLFTDSLWGLVARPVTPHYRLIVVGSTENRQGTVNFTGPYLRSLDSSSSPE